MKRIFIVALAGSLACRDRTPVVDHGGRSLDVPSPSTGVAAAAPARRADRDLFRVPERPKMDPSEIGARSGPYGTYLVDRGGRALYVFSDDTRGETACVTNCATVWPPVVVKKLPSAKGGVDAAQLGLLSRPDGARQLSYAGLPLYYSDSDLRPEDTWGHSAMSFGGRFSLLGVDGKPIPPPGR